MGVMYIKKDVLMPENAIKIGKLSIVDISATDIYKEGIKNDPEPYIKQIVFPHPKLFIVLVSNSVYGFDKVKWQSKFLNLNSNASHSLFSSS